LWSKARFKLLDVQTVHDVPATVNLLLLLLLVVVVVVVVVQGWMPSVCLLLSHTCYPQLQLLLLVVVTHCAG
jgi:hypothetical protein